MKFGTQGMMNVDYEERINFDRMRKDRVAKIHKAMEETDFSCLILFESGNKRYATSTAVASPEVDNTFRYAIVPRNGEPYIFGLGSESAAEKLHCPWIQDRTFGSHSNMIGAILTEHNWNDGMIADINMVLEAEGLSKDDPIGFDMMYSQNYIALTQAGFKLGDGQDVMMKARKIKTDDEIMCLRNAAATVDAAFYKMAQATRPGMRENELQAVAAYELHRLGAQWVMNIQMTTGSRTCPHPHLSSDRLIQPGDMVYADIVTLLNGYHTCYYRTMVCGKATQLQKDVYKSAYDMLYASIDKLRVGNTTEDVVKAWPTYEHWGFEKPEQGFGLCIGHGLGVQLYDLPIISAPYSYEHSYPLEEGMVVAIETYDGKGKDGARIEEMVVITDGDPEVISKFPCDELLECPIL